MRKLKCRFTKLHENPYESEWRTGCRKRMIYETPMDFGISFAPLPTDNGVRFCQYCGGRIIIDE